jgi:hypothetical protein
VPVSHEPYNIPHDQHGAGLRDYYRRPPTGTRAPSVLWFVVLVAFFLGFMLGTTAHASAADSCIRLQVRPQMMLQRGDIRIEARIPRHVDHRAYALSWTSDVGTEGGTRRQLEGEESSVLQTHWLKDYPPAHYLFTSAVYDQAGKIVGRDQAEILTPEIAGELTSADHELDEGYFSLPGLTLVAKPGTDLYRWLARQRGHQVRVRLEDGTRTLQEIRR